MSNITRERVMLVAGGLMVGGGAGYILASVRLKKQYESLIENEMAELREAYGRIRVVAQPQPFPSPQEAVEALVKDATPQEEYEEVVETLEYTETTVEVEEPIQKTNIFELAEEEPEGGHPGEEDLGPRDPNIPYVISTAEFMDPPRGYESITITYYEGDGTLADERDQIIDDVDGTIGDHNLENFGVGTTEDHIVYVRNERISADFEVVKEERGYVEAVLGMDPPEPFERNGKRRPRDRDDE